MMLNVNDGSLYADEKVHQFVKILVKGGAACSRVKNFEKKNTNVKKCEIPATLSSVNVIKDLDTN